MFYGFYYYFYPEFHDEYDFLNFLVYLLLDVTTSAEFPSRRRDLGHHLLRDVVQRGDGQHHDEHGIDDRSRHRHLPRLAEEKERGCFYFQADLE